MWESIQSGAAERDPFLLQRLILLTYCDLKQYKYYHWFAFPALQPPAPFTAAGPAASLAECFGPAAEQLVATCSAHARGSGQPAWLVLTGGAGGEASCHALSDWAALQELAAAEEGLQVSLAVADTCNLAGHPGWPLRNLLLLACVR